MEVIFSIHHFIKFQTPRQYNKSTITVLLKHQANNYMFTTSTQPVILKIHSTNNLLHLSQSNSQTASNEKSKVTTVKLITSTQEYYQSLVCKMTVL